MVRLLDLGPCSANPRIFNVGGRAGAEPGQLHDRGQFAKVDLTFLDGIVAHGGVIEPLISCTTGIIDLVGFGHVKEHFFHGIAVIVAKTEVAVDSGIVPAIQCWVILPDGKATSV